MGFLFYDSRKGKYITTQQVSNSYKRICEKAGIPYQGAHALRHTFASRKIEARRAQLIGSNSPVRLRPLPVAEKGSKKNLAAVEILKKPYRAFNKFSGTAMRHTLPYAMRSLRCPGPPSFDCSAGIKLTNLEKLSALVYNASRGVNSYKKPHSYY